MNRYDDLSVVATPDLIRLFCAHAIERSALDAAFEQRDSLPDGVALLAASRRMDAVYSELRRRGGHAQQELLPLLNQENVAVRKYVLSYAMEFAPDIAVPELEAAAARGGSEGIGAAFTLGAWKDGTLSKRPDTPYRRRPTLADDARWPAVFKELEDVLAVVSNCLDAEMPDVGNAFRRATLEKRRQVAVRATELAASEVGLSGPAVEEAQYVLRFEQLPAHQEHESMRTLSARLDQEASRLRSDPDESTRSLAVQYQKEARAAASIAIALTGDSTKLDEVICEAIAAWDEREGVIEYITGLLRK